MIPEGGQFCPKCGTMAVEIADGQQTGQSMDVGTVQGADPNAVQSTIPGTGQTVNQSADQFVNQNVVQGAGIQQAGQNVNQGVNIQPDQFVNQAVTPAGNQTVNSGISPAAVQYAGQGTVQAAQADKHGSALWGILAFFISMIGLILFFLAGIEKIILYPTIIASVMAIVLGIVGLAKNGRLKAFPIIAFLISLTNLILCIIVIVAHSAGMQSGTQPVSVEYGGMVFQIPAGYTQAESTDTYTIYSTPKDNSALLFCTADGRIDDGVFQVSADQFEPGIEELVGQMMSSYKKEGSVFGLVSDKPCYEIVYSGTLDDGAGYSVVSLINNRAAGQMVFVMIFCPEAEKDGALQAYQSMLAAAKSAGQ